SECSNCKYKALIQNFDQNSDIYKNAASMCSNCPHKMFTQKTVIKKIYHNERNRYGYRPMLKNNALKLLLLLHFFHPDRFGIMKNLDVRTFAEKLHCNIKTIWNNLEILKRFTYISYSKTDTYTITLILNDYENYYLPANKNGRGFLVLSKDLMDKIIEVDSLVTLRIFLRELISLDEPALKGIVSIDHKTIKEIRHMLPSYCKPCIIKKSVVKPSEIFDVTVNDKSITFEINTKYLAKTQKQLLENEYFNSFRDFVYDFNSYIPEVNNQRILPDKYREFFDLEIPVKDFKLISISKINLEDLATIAVHYSYDLVINALSAIYKQYTLYDKHINNLPGLVTSFIRAELNTSSQAA
ncbi:MAG: hypothetical protein Q4F06_00975, partial [Eubacteriales bacterium]|nr:hypothetical protein [Eubacteriales bacterium]